MIDRRGQVWVFEDGMILLVVRSEPDAHPEHPEEVTLHAGLVVDRGLHISLVVGQLDEGYVELERNSWEMGVRTRRRIA